jgi:hypothetical protein
VFHGHPATRISLTSNVIPRKQVEEASKPRAECLGTGDVRIQRRVWRQERNLRPGAAIFTAASASPRLIRSRSLRTRALTIALYKGLLPITPDAEWILSHSAHGGPAPASERSPRRSDLEPFGFF